MEIISILIQVAQSEHDSEERAFFRSKQTEESSIKNKIINKSELTNFEVLAWDAFIYTINNKIIEE
jgi:hypothetical protein